MSVSQTKRVLSLGRPESKVLQPVTAEPTMERMQLLLCIYITYKYHI